MIDFLVIGGGMAGILGASYLSDDYKTTVIERLPIEQVGENIWGIMNEKAFRGIVREFGMEDIDRALFFDYIQIHDCDGRVLVEYNLPLVAVKVGYIHKAMLKTFDGFCLREKISATKLIEKGGIVIKVGLEGKKHEAATFRHLIDASGFSLFTSKKNMIRERHYLFGHNIYKFFQSSIRDIHTDVDKAMLHLVMCDVYTPGGFSVTFFNKNNAIVCGFYNEYMSKIPASERVNYIKNSLGILGILYETHMWRIPMCHPLVDVAYGNIFLLGASTLSIYPKFTSGVVHNMDLTKGMITQLIRIINEQDDISHAGYVYTQSYIYNHIYRGLVNDIIRLLLLTMRSSEIEEVMNIVIGFIKDLSKEKVSILDIPNMATFASKFLGRPNVARIIQKLMNTIIQLYLLLKDFPKDKNNLVEWSREYNENYFSRVKDIVNSRLLSRVPISDLTK